MPMFYVESSDPLADVEDFRTHQDAVARAKEIAADLEAEGFTCDGSIASRRNMYAVRCEKAGFRTVTIEVYDEQ